MKYRKKPIIIEAFKYDGDLMGADGNYYVPNWAIEAHRSKDLCYIDDGELYVCTLEGELRVDVGDYIIRGIEGELYPCKPSIFEATYEAVED